MSIEKKVTNLLSTKAASSAIKTILGPAVAKSEQVKDQAIKSVLQEFVNVTRDNDGGKRLYDAVVLTDQTSIVDRLGDVKTRDSALDSAEKQLRKIVGQNSYRQLHNRLQTYSSLTESQAKNTLALVSNGVVESLKSELQTVEDSAAGITKLLGNSKSEPNSNRDGVPVSESALTHHSNSTNTSGNASAVKSESIMRFAPILLLGALLLGTLKYCSDSEKNKVVVEERTELQQQLGLAREEIETETNKIAALKSEHDSAKTRIAELESELEITTARLDAERNVPKDTATLQRQLTIVTKERDKAVENSADLSSQLNRVSNKHDKAKRELVTVRAEAESARSIIRSNSQAIENLDQLKADAAELAVKHDEVLKRNTGFVASNKTLQEKLDLATSTNASLESKVTELTEQRDRINRRLRTTLSSLDKEKKFNQTEGQKLNLKIDNLRQSLASTDPALSKLESQITSLHNEVAVLEAKLELKAENLDQERVTAKSKLEKQINRYKVQGETISGLQDKIAGLEKSNMLAADTISGLQQKVQSLDNELDSATNMVANAESMLKVREDSLIKTNEALANARVEIAEITKSGDKQLAVQDGYRQKIVKLTEEYNSMQQVVSDRDAQLNALNDKFKTTIAESNTEIDLLTASNTEADNEIYVLNQRVSELVSSAKVEKSVIADLEKSIASLETALELESERSKDNIEEKDAQLNVVGQQLLLEQQNSKAISATLADLSQKHGLALEKIEQTKTSLNAENQSAVQPDDTREVVAAEEAAAATKSKAAEKNKALSLRDAVQQQISDSGLTGVMVKSLDDNQSVAITLGSGSLFETDDSSLTRDGSRTLNKIGNVLANYPGWRIAVEGHTDSLPVAEKQSLRSITNEELSSAQASSVVMFLKLTTAIESDSLSSIGYAETKPIADNSTAEGREANKRVEITLKR